MLCATPGLLAHGGQGAPTSPKPSCCRRGNAHQAAPRSPSCCAGTVVHEPGLEPQPCGSRDLLEGFAEAGGSPSEGPRGAMLHLEHTGKWRCLQGQGPGPVPQPGDTGWWQTPERARAVKPHGHFTSLKPFHFLFGGKSAAGTQLHVVTS